MYNFNVELSTILHLADYTIFDTKSINPDVYAKCRKDLTVQTRSIRLTYYVSALGHFAKLRKGAIKIHEGTLEVLKNDKFIKVIGKF